MRTCASHSVLFSALAVTALAGIATGDPIPPPRSYARTSPDGRYVFVMLSPREAAGGTSPDAVESPALRARYAQSGLYPNDGSTTPLWTVDWYSRWVRPLSDGVHLVRTDPAATSAKSPAVSFFASGQLINSYVLHDLMDVPSTMPASPPPFWWRSDDRLDDAEGLYEIATAQGDYFVFDVRKGKRKGGGRPRLGMRHVAMAALAAGVAGLAVLWAWRRRRKDMTGVPAEGMITAEEYARGEGRTELPATNDDD